LADSWTIRAARRPAHFFLTDVYGDHDFTRRDADIARVLPTMQHLLPASLLETVGDGIALGSLTHAFDLRMAQVLHAIAPTGGGWTMRATARRIARWASRGCATGRSG
jgi:hypothetical protein